MTESNNVQDQLRQRIYTRVHADLNPSRWVVHGKIGTSVTLGGVLSLFLCGQLGLGLSSVAMASHAVIMNLAGSLGCTFVCGILFAVVPVLSLRMMTSGIQFVALTRREWRAIAMWMIGFGSILAYESNRSDPLWELLLWAAAAIGSFEILARGLQKLSIALMRNTQSDCI